MNLRSLFLRACLVAALIGVAFLMVRLVPRLNPDIRTPNPSSTQLVFLPLVALPLVQALLLQ